MFDSTLRPYINPPLNQLARIIGKGATGTGLTVFGLIIGLTACVAAFLQYYDWALVLLLLNRLIDGLDGPVARYRKESSDFGGYLDIFCDYIVYGGFPLFMAGGTFDYMAMTAAAFVLFCIVLSGVSFLAFAIFATKKVMETNAQGKKSFYFSKGLMEGTETIIFLCLLCLFPNYFAVICCIFGILCLLTAALRVRKAYHVFK